jgi:hypothetical protein
MREPFHWVNKKPREEESMGMIGEVVEEARTKVCELGKMGHCSCAKEGPYPAEAFTKVPDPRPEAPEGYEWVLMPSLDLGGREMSPGETGHYSQFTPQPAQVIAAWKLDWETGSALKYLARYPKKGGVEDLEKVKWFSDQLIARERREGRG